MRQGSGTLREKKDTYWGLVPDPNRDARRCDALSILKIVLQDRPTGIFNLSPCIVHQLLLAVSTVALLSILELAFRYSTVQFWSSYSVILPDIYVFLVAFSDNLVDHFPCRLGLERNVRLLLYFLSLLSLFVLKRCSTIFVAIVYAIHFAL